MTAWVNGAWLDDGAVGLADRGLTLGDGLFETLLLRGGHPVFFADHMARLRASAQALGLLVPYDDDTILAALRALDAHGAGDRDRLFAARITLTRGAGARGIVPPPAAEASPVMAITGAATSPPPDAPAACRIVSIRRNEGSPASRMKTLSYIDNVLARQEAAGAGADEAIMLNNAGDVVCASVANIFLADGDGLVTPPLGAGVLPGIVRARLIAIAARLGIALREARVSPQRLEDGTFFLTNSLIGLRRGILHGREGAAPPSDLFSALERAYRAEMAADSDAGRKG